MSGGARSNMAAVELDGLIYVIGGKNSDGALSRVEVYDPVADTWSNASDLPSSFTASQLSLLMAEFMSLGVMTVVITLTLPMNIIPVLILGPRKPI